MIRAALARKPILTRSIFSEETIALRAATMIERLNLASGDSALLDDLLSGIARSADPLQAFTNFERFLEQHPQPSTIRQALKRKAETSTVLITLFAGSQFLSDVLIRQPEYFEWLMEHDTLHGSRRHDYYSRTISQLVSGIENRPAQRVAISQWRYKEYLRIGCRDLMLIASAEESSRDISDLAQSIINEAAQLIYRDLVSRFGNPVPEQMEQAQPDIVITPDATAGTGMCVLGMGKLGGRELNFSSDIDLIFIYEGEGETTGRMDGERRVARISNHDFFTRMGEALVKFLAERGADGHLFRVDMRLRPEGGDGPLVRSLESFVNYLTAQGRDWERLAYLKARVVSGPARLAEKLYRIIAGFVYAGLDAPRIVAEVQELKLRIDREVIISDSYNREVKRGYGGIREIEFVVSAMQIIHGYRHRALRVRNTFLAIERLKEVHIIPADTAAFYQQAYSFLRMVEHRLQMAQEAQTHTLPLPGPEMEAVARRCGFANANAFNAEYQRITDDVHQRFVNFFERDTASIEQEERDIIVLLDREATRPEAMEALNRLGLQDPDAIRLIHALAYGTRDVFVSPEGQKFFEQMLPALLRLCTTVPYPERVLSQLHSFALAIKGITYYYEVIAQHPEILKLLVTLFGTSESLSSQLIANPEFFDTLISTRILNEDDDAARQQRLRRVYSVNSPNARLVMLRKQMHFERIVIGLQYLLELRSLPDCLQSLSKASDEALSLCVELAVARLVAKATGVDRPDDKSVSEIVRQLEGVFAVIALGKFGGRELNFFGDLDVIFVYDEEAEFHINADSSVSSQQLYDNLADAIVAVAGEQMRGGRVFELDARLRPHGRGAPLTTALSVFQKYLKEPAETWELQAYQRARLTWGSRSITNKIREAARSTAYDKPPVTICRDIHEMRTKLEATVEPGNSILEVKRSAGGIVDVEFLIQYLVLSGRLPWSQETVNYFHVLETMPGSVLDQKDSSALSYSYDLLRRVENSYRLISGSSDSAIPVQSAQLRATAKSLGSESSESFVATVKKAMQSARTIYEKVFADCISSQS